MSRITLGGLGLLAFLLVVSQFVFQNSLVSKNVEKESSTNKSGTIITTPLKEADSVHDLLNTHANEVNALLDESPPKETTNAVPLSSSGDAPPRQPVSNIPAYQSNETPTILIRALGGSCGEDDCWRETGVDTATGHYLSVDQSGTRKEGSVSQSRIDEIRSEIAQTNFYLIRRHVFTGSCPFAGDGKRHIYIFHFTTATESLDECKNNLGDVPLILLLEEVNSLWE